MVAGAGPLSEYDTRVQDLLTLVKRVMDKEDACWDC